MSTQETITDETVDDAPAIDAAEAVARSVASN